MTVTIDTRRPATSQTPTAARACRCGQQLDCCSRSHCPRCGRTLTPR